jgi:hypothetical protein
LFWNTLRPLGGASHGSALSAVPMLAGAAWSGPNTLAFQEAGLRARLCVRASAFASWPNGKVLSGRQHLDHVAVSLESPSLSVDLLHGCTALNAVAAVRCVASLLVTNASMRCDRGTFSPPPAIGFACVIAFLVPPGSCVVSDCRVL